VGHSVGSSVGSTGSVTVSFVERYARSDQFDQIFKEGMALVEAAATYLDGDGRKAAKSLTPGQAVIYAAESMRLTTRLLELASWLLVRRSLKSGEISPEEARIRRRRIKLATLSRPSHVKTFADLPTGLQDLIEKSYLLNDRIVMLDRALDQPATVVQFPVQNVVRQQVQALTSAFEKPS